MSNYDPNQPGQPYNPNSGDQGANQNPYGENPYGQQPSPYGQNPYGQNPYSTQPPATGYNQDAAQAQGGFAGVQPPTERPRTLTLAFGLIMLSGVLSALASWLIANSNMLANMVSSQWAMVEAEFQNQLQLSPELAQEPMFTEMMSSPEAFMSYVNPIISSFVIITMIITVGAYFLVGFFVGRGVAAMRIIATIFAAISLLNLFTTVPMINMFGDTQAGLISAIYILGIATGIAGVVFAWLRPSSEYILQRRRARLAGFR